MALRLTGSGGLGLLSLRGKRDQSLAVLLLFLHDGRVVQVNIAAVGFKNLGSGFSDFANDWIVTHLPAPPLVRQARE